MMALEGQDQRHGVLGDRVRIDAGGVGEADAVRAEDIAVVLVDAGADRLYELEPLGLWDEIVLPHHRHHHHVGLGQRRGKRLGRLDLDMGNAGAARGEPVGHAIGGMGKADLELVFGGKQHGHSMTGGSEGGEPAQNARSGK